MKSNVSAVCVLTVVGLATALENTSGLAPTFETNG